MSKESPSIPQLFSRLDVLSKNGDYEAALPVAEKLLQQEPNDLDALRCKLVFLVHQSKFKDALSCIKRIRAAKKDGGATMCVFEEAYCLYRQEKYQDGWKVLLQHPSQESECVKELKAQISYRMEQYPTALKLFQQLLSQSADEYGEERTANALATATLGQQIGTVSSFELCDSTFEQCFNSACYCLAVNDGVRAEQLLKMAEEKCRSSLQEEDYTDEEIEEEVGVIKLQLGCAYMLREKADAAMHQFTAVLKQKPSDVIQTIVASNNIIALNRDKDIFDSKKRVKALTNEPKLKAMTSLQRLSIMYNRCLFSLHMNQLEQCKLLLKEMVARFPDSELCLMANLALLNREKKSTSVEKMQAMLDEYLAKNFSIGVCLLRAQLPLLAQGGGDLRKVCSVLQRIPDLSQYLGVVAVLVSFLTQLGAPVEAIAVLDTAVEYWTERASSTGTAKVVEASLLKVMQANARYKLGQGEHRLAAITLEKLYRHDPQDIRILAQLIDAYSKFDPAKAEQHSQSLPRFQHSSDLDVLSLEQAPQYTRKSKDRATATAALLKGKPLQGQEVKVKTKAKKKKKPRLPKKYNPNAPPDPERWLPLKERSYYKRGKKKGFVPVGRGTQGSSTATSKLASLLDASAKPAPAKPNDGDQQQPAKAKPAAQAAAQKKKPPAKKKKKGKGW